MRDNVTEQLSWIGVDGTDWAWVIFRLGVEVVAFAVLQGGHLEYDLVVALLIHREILKVRERMWVAALALSKGSILEIAFDIGQLDRSAVFAFVALLEQRSGGEEPWRSNKEKQCTYGNSFGRTSNRHCQSRQG